jgi:hypothetical protein
MTTRLWTERKVAANTGFASGGVTCKLRALCFYSSFVHSESIVLLSPAPRQAVNVGGHGEGALKNL